eukprot:82557_1
MCPNCNFLIFASKKTRKKCGAKNPAKSSGKSDKPGKSGGRRGNKKYGKSGGDEWICYNCSSSNYPDRDQCRKCKTKRADTAAVDVISEPGAVIKDKSSKNKTNKDKKGGEWTCNSCNSSNYADRDKCRKCNTLREEDNEEKKK